MPTPRGLALAALTVALIAACSSGGSPSPTPSPNPRATPTPIAVPVVSAEDAAARVIVTDPRFAGARQLSNNLIGGSRWWEARALDGGAWQISLTIGWGDCPAGCISRHTWVFHVGADGQVTLISETGEPVPNPLPA